jgi:hypothetical protein
LSDLGKLNDEFLPPKYKKEDIIKEIEAKEKNLLSGSYEKSQGKMSTIPTAAAVDSETTKTKDKSSIAETKETTTAAAPTKNIHDLIVSVPTNPGATVTSTSPKKDEKKERRGSKAEKIVENIKEG